MGRPDYSKIIATEGASQEDVLNGFMENKDTKEKNLILSDEVIKLKNKVLELTRENDQLRNVINDYIGDKGGQVTPKKKVETEKKVVSKSEARRLAVQKEEKKEEKTAGGKLPEIKVPETKEEIQK